MCGENGTFFFFRVFFLLLYFEYSKRHLHVQLWTSHYSTTTGPLILVSVSQFQVTVQLYGSFVRDLHHPFQPLGERAFGISNLLENKEKSV